MCASTFVALNVAHRLECNCNGWQPFTAHGSFGFAEATVVEINALTKMKESLRRYQMHECIYAAIKFKRTNIVKELHET